MKKSTNYIKLSGEIVGIRRIFYTDDIKDRYEIVSSLWFGKVVHHFFSIYNVDDKTINEYGFLKPTYFTL